MLGSPLDTAFALPPAASGEVAPGGRSPKVTFSLPEQIANRLVEEIILGIYEPGQRLGEAAIAEAFGVSRGPVREALRIVEREGLAEIRPRYGAFVVEISTKIVSEIFEVRAHLLALAAGRIAHSHTGEMLALLCRGTADLRDALDQPEAFLNHVYRYTMHVVDLAGNDLSRSILVSLARRTLHLTRVALLDAGNRRLWLANWDNTVEAIAQGKGNRAEAGMRRLVEAVGRSVVEVLERGPPERGRPVRMQEHKRQAEQGRTKR